MIKDSIDKYFELANQIHEHFGYVEDWKVIPMSNETEYYWMIIDNEDGRGICVRSDEPFTEDSIKGGNRIYSGSIYTQRFLNKYVYRSEDYTMAAIDTQTDGNKFLMIFDNEKECNNNDFKKLYKEHWG